MKRIKTAILFLVLSLTGYSQTVDLNFSTVESLYDKNIEEYHYALADSVNIRKCPTLNCEKTGILRIGQRMILKKMSEKIDTINEIKSYWYKIQTENNSGWIFGSFIAQQAFGSVSDPSVKFVYGLKGFDHNENWSIKIYQIRAIKNNKEIDRIEFPIYTTYINSIKTIGNQGLNNLKDVIVIDIPCVGGCGCTTGELVIFWNGEKFSKVEELLGSADAWASDSKRFIYPTDMEGIENTIVKVSELYIEEISEDKIKRGITKEYFKWNGNELISDLTKKTEEKSYIIDK